MPIADQAGTVGLPFSNGDTRRFHQIVDEKARIWTHAIPNLKGTSEAERDQMAASGGCRI
ncbi:hypothetical protein D3C87_2134300 [compost metagenome]